MVVLVVIISRDVVDLRVKLLRPVNPAWHVLGLADNAVSFLALHIEIGLLLLASFILS